MIRKDKELQSRQNPSAEIMKMKCKIADNSFVVNELRCRRIRFLQDNDCSEDLKANKTNLDYEPIKAPSVDPLPVPWTKLDLIFKSFS